MSLLKIQKSKTKTKKKANNAIIKVINKNILAKVQKKI